MSEYIRKHFYQMYQKQQDCLTFYFIVNQVRVAVILILKPT